MKIAIVSKFGHFECLGFLLETMKNHDISLFADQNSDKFKWIDYYTTYYKFNICYHLAVNPRDFHHIIKITSNDECLYSEDTISILHLECKRHINNNSKKYISLTPYITGNDIYYMFPIFKPNIVKTYKQSILFVGYYINSDLDEDTILFIQANINYHFTFITWGDISYSNLNNLPNVSVLHNIETAQLVDKINDAKYILSKKYINYDRFSGMLSLAMSFEKPMIIDSKTATSYKLPGIIFDKHYGELGDLNDISDDRYNNIVSEIRKSNAITFSKNVTIFNDIIVEQNTVLLIEPRIIENIPEIIEKYRTYLPNWRFVFYCGKDTKIYWENRVKNYVELRELDVDNFDTPHKYSFFLKQKKLWETLYGDFVLTIQADTMIMSIEPYNIDYFINLNKSYIGGNMNFCWNELKRENITFNHYNFNGGLSLRKRSDMITVIKKYPPILFDGTNIYSSNIQTDPEDVYFTLGCYKLGLPVGDDEESSHFAVHKIYKTAFFGFHQPCKRLKSIILNYHAELEQSYLL